MYPARLRNQALYSFINPPLSFLSLSPKVNRVSVTCLMATVCVRSLSGAPVFRTVVTSHLWATRTNGRPLPLHLIRTPTTVLPVLPPGSHRSTRYYKGVKYKDPDDNKLLVEAIMKILSSGATVLVAGAFLNSKPL